MYICPNCNNTSEQATNFCPSCGARMVQEVPIAQPVYQQTVSQPMVYAHPINMESNKPGIGKVIVGMVFGIVGFVFALMGIYMVLVSLAAAGDSYYFYEELMAEAATFGLIWPMFSMPLSLVGMNISRGNRNNGDSSAMSNVGKILGMIGFIISCVLPALGIIILANI